MMRMICMYMSRVLRMHACVCGCMYVWICMCGDCLSLPPYEYTYIRNPPLSPSTTPDRGRGVLIAPSPRVCRAPWALARHAHSLGAACPTELCVLTLALHSRAMAGRVPDSAPWGPVYIPCRVCNCCGVLCVPTSWCQLVYHGNDFCGVHWCI